MMPAGARRRTIAVMERPVSWDPATPRLRPLRLLLGWVVGAASIWIAAWVLSGVSLERTGAAFLAAALIAVLNAIVPPVLAALRLPFMLAFGSVLLAAVLMSAVGGALQVVLGTNDDDEYTLRVTRRIARRQGTPESTDV